METHGPCPRVVGGLLCAVHGDVLIAYGPPDFAAYAAFLPALAAYVAVDARAAVVGVLLSSRAIAAAVAATIDPHVMRRPVAIVADEPVVPSLGLLTLHLHRHQRHTCGKEQN